MVDYQGWIESYIYTKSFFQAMVKSESTDEKIEKGSILARAIIEVAGAPKEHVEKSIEIIVDHIKKQDYIELTSEEIYAAEEKNSMFTSFAELEFWVPNMAQLIGFEFDFMPSSIEILEPAEKRMKASEISGLLNDLFIRLHTIHSRVKNLGAANQVMQKNSVTLLGNFIFYVLKEKELTIAELVKVVGIPEQQLQLIVEGMVKEKRLKKNKDKYLSNKKD